MAQKKESTEVQKKSPSEVIPEYLAQAGAEAGRLGFEEMTGEDILLPRLQIGQALSPQLNKRDPSFIVDLELGQFFNSVSMRTYGESLDIVPLFFFHSAVNIQDGKVKCMSKNARACPLYGTCKCNAWGEGESVKDRKPECQLLYNYVCTVPEYEDVVVVSLKSTGIKIAKKWNSLMSMLTRSRNLPMFSRKFTASAVPAKNAAGQEFFQWKFADAGFTPENVAKQARLLVDSLRGKVIVDVSGLEHDDEDKPEAGEADY